MELRKDVVEGAWGGADKAGDKRDDDDRSVCSNVSNKSASERTMTNMAKLAALEASRKFAEREAAMELERCEAEQRRKQIELEAELKRKHLELEHKQLELDKEAAMERERCAAAHKRKQLDLEKEAAVALAELQVYKQYEAAEMSGVLPEFSYSPVAASSNQQQVYGQFEAAEVSGFLPVFSYSPGVVSTQQVSSQGPRVCASTTYYSQPRMTANGTTPTSMSCVVDNTGLHQYIPSGQMPVVNTQNSSSFDVTASVVNALNQNQLPKIELSVFSGEPLAFQGWLVSFEKLIEDATLDPVKRLHYLSQFTSGSAKLLVSGFMLNQTNDSYLSAKRELMKEYGNPYITARAYLNKIESWKTISVNDVAGMKAFCVLLKSCRGSMCTLKHLDQLNTDLYLRKIISKLSVPVQATWRRHVYSLESSFKNVDFNELVEFISAQCEIQSHPVFSAEALKGAQSTNTKSTFSNDRTVKVAATNVGDRSNDVGNSTHAANKYVKLCPKCNANHDLDSCSAYLAMPVEERQKFVKFKHLCFACYGRTSQNHSAKTCRRRRTCRICKRSHPTGLHGLSRDQGTTRHDETGSCDESAETTLKVVACTTDVSTISNILMSIVMVRLLYNDKETIVYAALDSMSSGCFISRDVWKMIGCPGEPTEIQIKTINDEYKQRSNVINGLLVSSLDGRNVISLPKVYMQNSLPVQSSDIVSHEVLNNFPYLQVLLSEIPDRNDKIPIGLLIGVNCTKALEPIRCIPAQGGGPTAVQTVLGWSVAGPIGVSVNALTSSSLTCNLTMARDSSIKVKESGISDMIKQMYESDFSESVYVKPEAVVVTSQDSVSGPVDKALSLNDRTFMNLMETGIKFDGHYQLPIPIISSAESLPCNRMPVLQRLQRQVKRFNSDSKYHTDYCRFIEEMITKNYATRSRPQSQGKWYVPHHGVYHPKKPEKIRVVFDCSFQFKGASLNKILLQGPDLTNSLVGVLLRFRQETVGVAADIEAMFYQVQVPEIQQDYLRFLWWPDGNTNMEPEDYQMTVHLFGATSSPSCANYALLKTASDNELKFGPEAAKTLRRNFYVDDMLKSVKDEATALQLIPAVKSMCAAGGFNLTKFTCNSKHVIEFIPADDRSKNLLNVDLSQSTLPMERALGVNWCVESDKLTFRINLKDKPFTRRGILSTISSIYDPLGLAAPFLLKGKKLLQSLCHSKLDWDDPVDDETRVAWEQWRSTLLNLQNIEVDRCYKPTNFGEVVSVSIHHFSDACVLGYGQCSYVRLVNETGEIHCSLITGRSRVSPMKPVTIPRLELVAATVSVKVSHMLLKELEYERMSSYFWTDSKAVLGYIANDAKRFHVFVANRIQLIRDYSSVSMWNYVNTELNPADDASRGITCDKASGNHRWFKGPEFLWIPEEEWPIQCKESCIDLVSDPEVKKQAVVCATQVVMPECCAIEDIFSHCSSWYKLRRHVAWIIICIDQLKKRVKGEELRSMKQLTVQDLQNAEIAILRYVQRKFFKEEYNMLKLSESGKKVNVKQSSALYSLSPVLDANELICISGRLKYAAVDDCSKHQIIIPKKHHVAELIVDHYHRMSGHAGREIVMALVRERYWIIGARQLIRKSQKGCFTCRKLFSQPAIQRMADLPEDRLVANLPPFTFVGVDFFGPFIVKVGRNDLKRYGCIFTCLTLRAVHIEVAYSLEADSFINALQRFICRRGKPVHIRSDNGTNFVGAERELREAVVQWNNSQMQEFLLQKEIRWKFNPPAASHMGGVWERQIRTVRKLLSALMAEQKLSDESLHTMLCVVENIINSRPISPVSDDPNDLEALTPNHLLQLRSGPVVPPGCFVKQDVYSRRRWRQVQYLSDVFWKRWTHEYLPTLQSRFKWNQIQRNFAIGDFVLIKDETLPRNSWLYGRIVEVMPGRDNLVRTVSVKTKSGTFTRPIHKLCLLESVDDCTQ